MTPARNLPVSLALAAACVPLAIGIIWFPLITAAILIVSCAVLTSLLSVSKHGSLFLGVSGVLLAGYAFLGKGFAYVGVPPVYVGELVLCFGLCGAVMTGALLFPLRSSLGWLLLAFAAWCAIRTIPYIPTHGFDALRDAALWAYGLFAVLIAVYTMRLRCQERLPSWYGRALPWFLAWICAIAVFDRVLTDYLPRVGNAEVALIYLKPGDVCVHLAGVASFLILGLRQPARAARKTATTIKEWGWWILWVGGLVMYASRTRGGLLAILVSIACVLLVKPRGKWCKALVVGLCITGLFLMLDVEVDMGFRRKLSPQQILANLHSIAGDSPEQGLFATKQWRLNWWNAIIEYTVHGEYFWTGKGFGRNLADEDGFQVSAQRSLRSPHNGHLTVLARAGIPGLALWILLQGGFCIQLCRRYIQAQRFNRDRESRLLLWVLSYWIAFSVNGAFDVYLEGPQGGIWFWQMFGFGLALIGPADQRARAKVRRRQSDGLYAPSRALPRTPGPTPAET